MNRIIYSIVVCLLCLCTSATNVADGSITITTNGLVTISNETIYIKAEVDGRFELQIKDITGQSILFINGNGPAEFTLLTTAFRAGSYQISVRDIDDKVIYAQNFTL
jgi:hypothetical protein